MANIQYASQMLKQSQLASIYKATPTPSLLISTDPQYSILDANESFLSAIGMNLETIQGKPFLEIASSYGGRFPGNPQGIANALKKVTQLKEPIALQTDGNKHQTITLTPVFDKNGDEDLIIYSVTKGCSKRSISHFDYPGNQDDTSIPNVFGVFNSHNDNLLHMLKERIKELECLYEISNLDEDNLSIPALLKKAVLNLPQGWQYQEIAEAKIEYNGDSYTTPGYQETPWSMVEKREIRKGRELVVSITYLEQRPYHDEGPFLEEERNLMKLVINHLSLKIANIISRQEWAEKQEMLDKAYQLARIGTWEFDMDTHRLHWSSMTKEVHGFDEDYEPDVESTINLFKKGIHREIFSNAAHEAINNAQPFDVELKIISGKGDERWVRAAGEPEFEDGVCTKFYGISQDVSDRRKAEEDLLLRERRFRSLVQDGSDLIAILDADGNYKYVSPTSESILGIPADSLIATNAFEYIHEEDLSRLSEITSGLSPGEQINIPPFRFKDGRGKWRWVETTLTNMTNDPAVGGYIANSRDVTKQIHQQQKNLEALKEKETLLAEIHHRVKNNLAVVSGMMQLQKAEEENEELRDRLNDSIVRIKTMANIHEQLYQSNSFSKLAFADNIRALVMNIKQTFKPNADINIEFNCENIELNINQAIPCSLIVNEVITNIFKHAFPNKDRGNIDIVLSEIPEQNALKLTISDDGIGLPKDLDIATSTSLGLNLIKVLSEQLHANHRYETVNGKTIFAIEFEKDELKGIGNSLL